MPRRVHPLVQDAHDVYALAPFQIEEDVAADAIAPVAGLDLLACPPAVRVGGNPLHRGLDLENVLLGLAHIPPLLGVVPDRRQIALRRGSEPIRAHDFFAAMKASRSKSSAGPLSSPAMRAARSAAIRVSSSSSSRRAARTTSLLFR